MKGLRAKAALILILGVFILPLAVAWMMYSGLIPFRIDTTRNLGYLVLPVVPIEWPAGMIADTSTPDTDLAAHWVILFKPVLPCKSACRGYLTQLRQVHRAAGRDQQRIKLVILFEIPQDESQLQEIRDLYPQFLLANRPGAVIFRTLETAAHNSGAQIPNPGFYLVDPLGNIMMVYPQKNGPASVSKDLKRLLTWSQLDKSS